MKTETWRNGTSSEYWSARKREIVALVILFGVAGCAAPAPKIREENARASCRETATTKEKFQLTNSIAFRGGSGGESITLSHLDPVRFEECLRESGVTEASALEDVAEARHEENCRNRAMATESNAGAVTIVFDRDRYQACLGAPAP